MAVSLNKGRKGITEGAFPELERALLSYIKDVIRYMRSESPFRESKVIERARLIRDQMIPKLSERCAITGEDHEQTFGEEIKKGFKRLPQVMGGF